MQRLPDLTQLSPAHDCIVTHRGMGYYVEA